jgi:type III secretory pathway component EscU
LFGLYLETATMKIDFCSESRILFVWSFLFVFIMLLIILFYLHSKLIDHWVMNWIQKEFIRNLHKS